MPDETLSVACVDCGATFSRSKGNRQTRCWRCRRAYTHARKAGRDLAQAAERQPHGPTEIPGLIPVYHKGWPVDFARVDIEDWDRLKHLKLVFAARHYVSAVVDGRREYLHRIVLDLKPGVDRKYAQTDHINRDRLDNRKSNLRVVSARQNAANRGGIYERAA